MASKLKNFHLIYKSNKFKSYVLQSFFQKRYNFHSQPVNDEKKSNQDDLHKRSLLKYGAVVSLVSAISLLFYNKRNQWTISSSLFPAVHALAKNENSLRKKFNFISEVVIKSADAVVYLENPVLFRVGEMEIPAVQGGSGFIVKDDGLILTNAHVVADKNSKNLIVKLKDGRTFNGEIENVDFATDLATVKIEAENLPVMMLGSSADLKAGEWVIAMGSPLCLKDSVSVGIVSSLQRKGEEIGMNDMEFIQTDAAIVMGNSGGPLVNLDGEVVGVNALRVTSGISFAIPIDYAKEFLKKSEEQKKRGEKNVGMKWPNHIGVFMRTLTPEILFELRASNPYADQSVMESLLYGVLINSVSPGSPAFRSGLSVGDIIISVNGERLMGTTSFLKFLESHKFLNLKVFRGNAVITVILVPEFRPIDLRSCLAGRQVHIEGYNPKVFSNAVSSTILSFSFSEGNLLFY